MLAGIGIPIASSMTCESGMPMAPVALRSDRAGSDKCKMAAPKPEIPISLVPGEIETKFQRLNLHFRGPAIECA